MRTLTLILLLKKLDTAHRQVGREVCWHKRGDRQCGCGDRKGSTQQGQPDC